MFVLHIEDSKAVLDVFHWQIRKKLNLSGRKKKFARRRSQSVILCTVYRSIQTGISRNHEVSIDHPLKPLDNHNTIVLWDLRGTLVGPHRHHRQDIVIYITSWYWLRMIAANWIHIKKGHTRVNICNIFRWKITIWMGTPMEM